MSKLIFRNDNKAAIRKLLEEIGVERYECALKDEKIDQKPLGMKGFYIDFIPKTGEYKLFHTYPSGVTLFIMDVLGYWRIPGSGWERILED